MAIHIIIEKQCMKYLMPGEQIYATIISNPFCGTTRHFCVTNYRIFEIDESFFSSHVSFFHLADIRRLRFSLVEGIFNSTIIINNGENEFLIPSVNKRDAKEFLSSLEFAINQNLDLLSQQTKICPMCAETVKLLAKKCKYCGYQFP